MQARFRFPGRSASHMNAAGHWRMPFDTSCSCRLGDGAEAMTKCPCADLPLTSRHRKRRLKARLGEDCQVATGPNDVRAWALFMTISREPDRWGCVNKVTLALSRPGQPTDNCFIKAIASKWHAASLSAPPKRPGASQAAWLTARRGNRSVPFRSRLSLPERRAGASDRSNASSHPMLSHRD